MGQGRDPRSGGHLGRRGPGGSSRSAFAQLGQVDLAGNYANGTLLDLTASQMTLSGSTVTIVLGTRSGTAHHHTTPTTMVWTNPEGTATESGPVDLEF
jgi:hypothetical protein